MIPDHIADRYESAVKGAARDVYNTYGHFGVFTKRELVDEGWLIAQDRWETWPSAGYARTDLRQKLYHYVERGFPAHGINRVRTSDGRRIYQRTEFPWNPSVFAYTFSHLASALGIPDAAYADDGPGDARPFQRHVEWPAMNTGTWLVFASILFRDYLEVCIEFHKIDVQKRPGNRTIAEWGGRQERKRAMLRYKYARELAAAKLEALGYGKPEDMAA